MNDDDVIAWFDDLPHRANVRRIVPFRTSFERGALLAWESGAVEARWNLEPYESLGIMFDDRADWEAFRSAVDAVFDRPG